MRGCVVKGSAGSLAFYISFTGARARLLLCFYGFIDVGGLLSLVLVRTGARAIDRLELDYMLLQQ